MDWTSDDGRATLLQGDCMERLQEIPGKTFHACMTSPPYFALRSYLPAGHPDKGREIGSEPTPEAFVATMVAVFREVRRVLRDDGFLWVNLGDSYASTPPGNKTRGVSGSSTLNGVNGESGAYRETLAAGHATKRDTSKFAEQGNQLLMPHRVALALQADGWVLRDTVIWSKRSPMPSSQNGVRWERCRVKIGPSEQRPIPTATGRVNYNVPGAHASKGTPDTSAKWEPCPGCAKCIPNGGYVLRRGQGRTTTAHEYLFLFTKGNDYFWDMENCRESAVPYSRPNSVGPRYSAPGQSAHSGRTATGSTRIPRSVWTLSSEPTKFNHFATYPSELVRRCLMPLSPRGCCPTCGAQWAPMVESERIPTRPALNNKIWKHADGDRVGQRSDDSPNLDPERHIVNTKVIGYRPTCGHVVNAEYGFVSRDPVPCRVLDPFSGTGTTGQTACFLGHRYVGIELNAQYLEYAKEWIFQTPRWHTRAQQKATKKPKRLPAQQALGFMLDQAP